MMKGWFEGYSYVGIMPDGRKMRFATEEDYKDAFREMCMSNDIYKVQREWHVTSTWLAKRHGLIEKNDLKYFK